MREYYIRREGDEDASGPYDLDQITSLFEVGKLEKEAYVYDIDQEVWVTIEECAELMKVLFPEKKKLTLRSEDSTAESENEESDNSDEKDVKSGASEKTKSKSGPKLKRKAEEAEKKQSISVMKMLAQAEGREGDDPKGKSPIQKRAQAAFIGLRFTTFFILGSAASMIFLKLDLVLAADFLKMMESPYLIFATVDIILGFFLLLQVTSIFPLVRFRAAIGLGTLSILFLTSGDPLLAATNVILSVSIYFSTAALSLPRAAIPFGIIGSLGLAGYIALVILPSFS